MTSSQPVATPNALNFTPDNKRSYAYSGLIGVTNSVTTLLEFNTNSEYIIAELQVINGTASNEDFIYKVYFNDVEIARWHFFYASTIHQTMPQPYQILIPPFTKFHITAENNTAGTSRDHSVTLTGEAYGMTDTGFQ